MIKTFSRLALNNKCRRALIASAIAVTGILFIFPAFAQGVYPNKPIKIIVPFAPGGQTDNMTRVFAKVLGERLGQPILIDNRPGAGGNVGSAIGAQSAPDGYTLLAGFDGALVINPHVYSKMPFDTLKDLTPITNLGVGGLVLVAHPSVAANDLKSLIALLKAKPGSLSYGTAGTGSTGHLAGELFNARADVKMEHVPYKGGGSAVTDVLGGHIPLMYTSISTVQQYIKQGKLKGIAVSSTRRSPVLPDVPTFSEMGLSDFVVTSWVGLVAPAGTPKAIIDKLHQESVAALQSKEVRDQYAVFGFETIGNTPEQYGSQIREDLVRWGAMVKLAKVPMQ